MFALVGVVAAALMASAQMAGPPNSVQFEVRLAWDSSPDPSVTGYRVHYGVSPGQYTNSFAVGNVTTSTVSGLQNGVKYYFAVTAFDAAGEQSPYSNEISYQVAFSRLQLRVLPTHSTLTITGLSGQTYEVEATWDLVTWEVIGLVTTGPDGNGEFTEVNPTSRASRFYRLRGNAN